MVFVNSMSDLFHEDVADDYIEQVCQRHAAGELAYLPGADQAIGADAGDAPVATGLRRARAAHLVRGQRRESQARLAADRAPAIAPAGLRMLSVEPLLEDLGELDLDWHRLGHSGRRERAMEPGRWRRTGCGRSATSARLRRFRSSSSNGAACARTSPAASSTAGLMMKCPID